MRLVTHVDRAPHRAPLEVVVWDLPSSKAEDGWIVSPRDGHVRLAVLDGVTPWRAVCPPNVNAARWAVNVAAATLGGPEPIHDAIVAANNILHDPTVSPTRRAASACVAAVDVSWNGPRLVAAGVGAGDCEVWTSDHGRWVRVAGGDFLYPHWRAVLDDWLASHPHADLAARIEAEAAVVDDPARWRSTCLGRFAALEVEAFAVGADAVVLASDGAELCAEAFDDLDGWVHDRAAAALDDITVIRLR